MTYLFLLLDNPAVRHLLLLSTHRVEHTVLVWLQGYLPRDLWSLNSAYGSEGDLRECLRTLHECNLKAVADIVINHRCAHFQALPPS